MFLRAEKKQIPIERSFWAGHGLAAADIDFVTPHVNTPLYGL